MNTDHFTTLSPVIRDWLSRQPAAVQEAVRAALVGGTDTPTPLVIDCLRRLAELDVVLPNGNYFDIALNLLDMAGGIAFQVGLAHFKTENELRIFLSLAGTALYGDRSAIARFERGYGADAAIDDIVLFLQAELEMLDGGFPGEG